MIAGLAFELPFAWGAVLLPIAYLLFAESLERAAIVPFGSLALWRAARDEVGERAVKQRIRWKTVLRFLGLVAIVAAMARPVWVAPEERTTWRLVLGTGPAGALDAGDGGTRLEGALERALAFVADHPGDAFEWVAPPAAFDRAALLEGDAYGRSRFSWSRIDDWTGSDAPDAAFLAALLAAPGRDWADLDQAGAVLFPVAAGVPPLVRAGISAAAWPEVERDVAREGALTWRWVPGADLGLGPRGVAPPGRLEARPGPAPWIWVHGAAFEATALLGRAVDAAAEVNGWRVVRPGDALPTGVPIAVIWGPLEGEGERRVGGAGWVLGAVVSGEVERSLALTSGWQSGAQPGPGVRAAWHRAAGLLATPVAALRIDEPGGAGSSAWDAADRDATLAALALDVAAALEGVVRSELVPLAPERSVERDRAPQVPVQERDPLHLGLAFVVLALALLGFTLRR